VIPLPDSRLHLTKGVPPPKVLSISRSTPWFSGLGAASFRPPPPAGRHHYVCISRSLSLAVLSSRTMTTPLPPCHIPVAHDCLVWVATRHSLMFIRRKSSPEPGLFDFFSFPPYRPDLREGKRFNLAESLRDCCVLSSPLSQDHFEAPCRPVSASYLVSSCGIYSLVWSPPFPTLDFEFVSHMK